MVGIAIRVLHSSGWKWIQHWTDVWRRSQLGRMCANYLARATTPIWMPGLLLPHFPCPKSWWQRRKHQRNCKQTYIIRQAFFFILNSYLISYSNWSAWLIASDDFKCSILRFLPPWTSIWGQARQTQKICLLSMFDVSNHPFTSLWQRNNDISHWWPENNPWYSFSFCYDAFVCRFQYKKKYNSTSLTSST